MQRKKKKKEKEKNRDFILQCILEGKLEEYMADRWLY